MHEDEIEAAIAAYSCQEPRPGLEARIMANVRAAHAKSRWRFAALVFAAGSTAALYFAAIQLSPVPRLAAPVWSPPLPPAVAPLPRVAVPRKVSRLSKRSQFPTPVPLTDTERALLFFLDNASDETRDAFVKGQKPGTEPIHIDAIEIRPLQSDDRP